jgi:Flp pilus assembly protein TadG
MTERQRERGQALVWMVVFMPIFLAVIGLALDAGIVFDREQGLWRLARSAARSGAEQVDVAAYRTGGEPVLDPIAARAAALSYVARQGTGAVANVAANQQTVVVRVSEDVPLGFLRIVHLDSAPIAATGIARIATGAMTTTP